MARKYHNQKLQTNLRHREEATKDTASDNTISVKTKATNSLFLSNMIAKLERTSSTTPQNKAQTQNPHTQ